MFVLLQVQYIFTDKTGTLTENNMVFQRCSIDGVDYEHQILSHGDRDLKPVETEVSGISSDPRNNGDLGTNNDSNPARDSERSDTKKGDSFVINQLLYDAIHSSAAIGDITGITSATDFQSSAKQSLMYHQKTPLLYQQPTPPNRRLVAIGQQVTRGF